VRNHRAVLIQQVRGVTLRNKYVFLLIPS